MQDLPTDAAVVPERSGISHDFKSSPIYGKMPITYNAGTLEKVSFSLYRQGRLEEGDLTCGFVHYEKSEGRKVKLPSFDAYLLAVCYGAFSNGKERGEINYSSNYVLDTRTDIMQCVYFAPKGDGFEIKTVAKGNYKLDIVPALTDLGRKNFYTKVLVCYIPQLQEVRAIHLSKVSEAGFLAAIAEKQGIPEYKASFFGLSDLSTQVWGFRFSGKFSEPVVFSPNEAKNVPPTVPAKEDAPKVYFQPKIQAFVFGPNTPGWESRFEKIAELRDLWFGYLSSEQTFLAQKQEQKQAVTAPPLPTGYDPNNPASPDPFAPRVPRENPPVVNSDEYFPVTFGPQADDVSVPLDIEDLPF